MSGNLARIGWLAVFMLLVGMPAAVAAPTTPSEDFSDNGDGTVTHRITGLTWMRCAMGMTWTDGTCAGTASTYPWDQARKLTAAFAGKSDWRLPGITELSSIVERDADWPAINVTIFPKSASSTHFWSASVAAHYPDEAWYVDFFGGDVFQRSKLDAGEVRLVRGGQSFDPMAPTTPTADFIDNGDGTLTHIKTGWMWKRCAEGQTWNDSTCSGSATVYDWDTAVALTSSSAGHNDWRLPTANELLTIVEYQAWVPAMNTTLFPDAFPNSDFWSASAVAGYPDLAWTVDFGGGYTATRNKYIAYPVRLVRAGQVFSRLGFAARTGVAPNAVLTSNALRVAGITGPAPISIAGGSYAVNGGTYTAAPGTVNPNDGVTVRLTASASFGATTRATLTIGAVSGEFSVSTAAMLDSQAPDVPGSLTATPGGDNRIDLAWSAASDDVGTTAYQLYRNGSWLAALGNVTGYSDQGLTPATTYTYRVAACDAAGNCSAQSATAAASTAAAQALTPTTPSADFTDNGDGTVTHGRTGLTWMRCAMGMTWTGTTCAGTANDYTWNEAVALKPSFAGKSDWRLPGIAELGSIVERGAYLPAIESSIFPLAPASVFWSASASTYDSTSAWAIAFDAGHAWYEAKDIAYPVRLVRAAHSLDPMGPSTPTADFIDNGDGTVTHLRTGLMWKRCAEGQAWNGSTCSLGYTGYDWGAAVAMTADSAGYNDWRLPTANELQSIVEYQGLDPAINTTVFPNMPRVSFWSASAVAYDLNNAWFVDFTDGAVFDLFKSSASSMVRLVRAGQFFSTLGFAARTGVAPNAVVTSNALRVAGITGPTPVSIVGGSYAVNGGTWTSAPGTVKVNDSVAVRLTAAASLDTSARATLTIGGVSGDFSVSTLADTQPPLATGALATTSVSASQVNLGWSAYSDNVGVTHYRIYRNGVLLAVTGDVTRYSDTKLDGATRFDYAVEACDAADNCSAPGTVATAAISAAVKTLPMLAAGASHSAGLKSDGSLWTWGYNNSGQLGATAAADSSSRPQSVGSGYITVALGGGHSAAIKTDGSLWSWGANASGQLGDGTSTTRTAPAQIGTGYIVVAAGSAHTLAIKEDGSLWAWGSNTYGQLGDGTGNDRYAPALIGAGFTAVAAGAYHTLALKTDGSLWAWGLNDAGQLGDGSIRNLFVPTLIGAGVSSIAAGASHSIALDTDGSVWAWGSNGEGQRGVGTYADSSLPLQVAGLSGVLALAAGGDHSLALKSDGTVMSWGANNAGQLGDGTYAWRSAFGAVVNDTVTGILDLDTAVANNIPASAISKVIMEARKLGSIASLTLGTNMYFGAIDLGTLATGSFSASSAYKVYVAALAPNKSVYMLDANRNWSLYSGGPLREYVSNATLDASQHYFVAILENVDLSGLIGTRIFVGYGTDGEEMLAAQRYREIYVAQQEPTR